MNLSDLRSLLDKVGRPPALEMIGDSAEYCFAHFVDSGERWMGLHSKQLNHWSVKDKLEVEKPISLKEVLCKNVRNRRTDLRLRETPPLLWGLSLRVGGRDPFNSPECVTEIMGWRSNQSVAVTKWEMVPPSKKHPAAQNSELDTTSLERVKQVSPSKWQPQLFRMFFGGVELF